MPYKKPNQLPENGVFMTNIIDGFQQTIADTLVQFGVLDTVSNIGAMTLVRPKVAAHGELASNAAIVCAKAAKSSPLEFARLLAAQLKRDERVRTIEIAGPGFLNFVFESAFWLENLGEVIRKGNRFGSSNRGDNLRIILEFVSANPTGPLHVGHARGAVFGDSLGRLLEFTGFAVNREYYLNDGGAQVDTLARSAFLRYLEANGQEVEISENHYRGDYLKDVGKALAVKFKDRFVESSEDEWLVPIRRFATNAMVQLIHQDLAMLGVKMDNFFSESSLYDSGKIQESIDELQKRGLIYEGQLPPPKGGGIDNWEPRQQTLFRSTSHGDDVDRPIQKSDGSWTYFAPDIAYHHDKINRGFDELINVFGADHSGYVRRIKAVVSALSDGATPIDIKITQLVRVIKDGGATKMSKRAGEFVQLREAVEAVGADVTRFVMLMRKNDAQLDFDFDKVREQSRENPVFYVQYCYARICSLLKQCRADGIPVDDAALEVSDFSRLTHSSQIALARRIAEWPRVVEQASSHHEPHRIAFFLYELASEFHSLWTEGSRQSILHIIQVDDAPGTQARMALARATAIVISNGLSILGVTPIEKM